MKSKFYKVLSRVLGRRTRTTHFDASRNTPISVDTRSFELTSIPDLLLRDSPCSAINIPEVYVDLWKHPLSKLPSSAKEREFYETHTFRAPEMMIDRLENQYWFPESGFLVSPEGKVWHHSNLGQYADPHFLTTHAVENRKVGSTTEYIFHENILRNAPVVKGTHLIISHYASHNYGHYMLDMVPLIPFGNIHELPMLTRPLLGWQSKICNVFGLGEKQLHQCKERVYFLEKVLVSNRHNAESTYAASPRHREVFDEMRRRISKISISESPSKKIFVSRGTTKSRQLRNHDALFEQLEKRGFTLVRPELLSLESQVSVFSGAEIIVTEFGAAMTNVVFCKPGTKVIEIIPENQNDPWSVHLCASMQLEHVVLFQHVCDSDRDELEIGGRLHRNIYFRYDVDIGAVIDVVEAI